MGDIMTGRCVRCNNLTENLKSNGLCPRCDIVLYRHKPSKY
jgi:uncharacterized paraquat-inducible protein A